MADEKQIQELHNRLDEAVRRGVRAPSIQKCLSLLERGASGGRFMAVLSINGKKVWLAESPAVRADLPEN